MSCIKCPECQSEVTTTSGACPNCGYQLPNGNVDIKRKKTIIYLCIAVSVFLIIAAISMVTSEEFNYHLDNIDYYAEQYEDAKSHSSGFLGIHYSSLAREWKEMYDEAATYLKKQSIGAAVLGTAGILGLIISFTKFKAVGGKCNGTH